MHGSNLVVQNRDGKQNRCVAMAVTANNRSNRESTGGQPQHFDWIDALRGFAILAVMLVHSSQFVRNLPKPLELIANQGARGVQLFFIVSAVTLMHSLKVRESFDGFLIFNFYVRRFFRIVPMFWVAIVGYVLLEGTGPRYGTSQRMSPWDIGLTAVFLHTWSPNAINSVVPGGWSITAEAMFYVCLPFLFRRIKSLAEGGLLVLASFFLGRLLTKLVFWFLSPWFAGEEQYVLELFRFLWFPNQCYIFALGILTYFVLKQVPAVDGGRSFRFSGLSPAMKKSAIVLHLIWIFGIFALCFSTGGYRYLPEHFLFGLVFVILVWAFGVYPAPVLANRFTRHFGKISYSAYFIHFVVLDEMNRLVLPWYRSLTAIPVVQLVLVYGSCVIANLCLATLTHELIEKPGINWGKRFVRVRSLNVGSA